jgi:hypothetical protein
VTVSVPDTQRHKLFRIALFALLSCNTAYYLYAGTVSKRVDAVAWLVLLALFTLETGFATRGAHTAGVLRAIRLIAAAAVCASAIGYVIEQNGLDAVNSALWIAVVILLELEVRRPLDVARYHRWFTAITIALYAALAMLVIAWGWRGEWMDAYDALLWLLAFATIEMDVLNRQFRPTAI